VRALGIALKWWFLFAGVLLLAVLLAALVLWAQRGNPDRILAEPRAPNGDLTRSQVERLLSCAMRDTVNVNRRRILERSWVGRVAGEGIVKALCRDNNTYVKLVREGRAAARPLLDVVLDPRPRATTAYRASIFLAALDPYAAMQALSEPALAANAPPPVVDVLVRYCLPWGPQRYAAGPNPSQWLKSELESKTLDEIYLERLDVVVSSPDLTAGDLVVLTLLDRYYGDDLDEWLAKSAPEVLAFRNRELERGYDPVMLARYLVKRDFGGFDEDLLRRLYPNASDRAAMERLPYLVNYGWPTQQHPPEVGWRERLQAWYKANRAQLVYDPAKRRFVVGKPAAVGPAAPQTEESRTQGAPATTEGAR